MYDIRSVFDRTEKRDCPQPKQERTYQFGIYCVIAQRIYSATVGTRNYKLLNNAHHIKELVPDQFFIQ